MSTETLTKEPTEVNPARASSLSLWLESHQTENALTSVDAVAIAIIASAFYGGTDLSDWCDGEERIDTTSLFKNQTTIDQKSLHATFASWNKSNRTQLLAYLRERRLDVTSLFEELCQASFDDAEKKPLGLIFTPPWLADKIVREAMACWRQIHGDRIPPKLAADVACGSGVFLAQLNKYVNSADIVGLDIDARCIFFSKLLARSFKTTWKLSCQDPLLTVGGDLFAQQDDAGVVELDLLVGNPPFVRSQLLNRKYSSALQNRFPALAKGNYDLSILFLEHALQALAQGGVCSYIVSSKFMVSTYGRNICKRLAQDARVLRVLDFHDLQLFPDRTTYTCVITFAKLPPEKQITVVRFKNEEAVMSERQEGSVVELPSERLSIHPWDLSAGEQQEILKKLREERNPLISEIFGGILQGMRTGCNEVFVLTVSDARKLKLEPELLLPFVTGEDVRRCKWRKDRYCLLFPYRRNEYGEVVPFDVARLENKYPNIWRHLNSHKAVLEARDLDPSSPWYAYSRSQNLNLPWQKKILVREMMPRAEFAADEEGAVAFCAGYALRSSRMDTNDFRVWASVLSTSVMEFSLRHCGTQLHSGWFRLLKHHLQRVRLPCLSESQMRRLKEIAARLHQDPNRESDWELLNSIVATAFGLSKREAGIIKAFVRSCHNRSLSTGSDSNRNGQPGTVSVEGSNGNSIYQPVVLSQYDNLHVERPDLRRGVTFQINKELPIHRWYSFTQGFSEPLVKALLDELKLTSRQVVLDPFAGCGTTLLTARLSRINSIGVEISPFMAWVGKIKSIPWQPAEIEGVISKLAKYKLKRAISKLPLFADYLGRAYSPEILGQIQAIAELVRDKKVGGKLSDFLLLGLVSIMEEVSQIRKHGSHYRFLLKKESIGVKKLNIPVINPKTDIFLVYLQRLKLMAENVKSSPFPTPLALCKVLIGDARHLEKIAPNSCNAVITSPPYLNRNNYIAQQKAEMVLLEFLHDYHSYRNLVKSTLRSHVEANYGANPESDFSEVRQIINKVQLSFNNNAKIPHMIAGYFQDLNQVLAELNRVVVPRGACAFVVGNCRWGGVVVPVDHLLLMLAERNGFEPVKILVTRLKGNSPQQMRRYGRVPVRESVVVFRKKG